MRFAVFASGNGSNFEAIQKAAEKGAISATLVCLFTDQKESYAVIRAQNDHVPYYIIEKNKNESKVSYENKILSLLEKEKIDFICLAGYMKILGKTMLDAFPRRVINLHPSLLPNFPGKSAIYDAYQAGADTTGITIHLVDQGIDTGPIIFQHTLSTAGITELASLEKRIHELEHHFYPIVIEEFVRELELSEEKKSFN